MQNVWRICDAINNISDELEPLNMTDQGNNAASAFFRPTKRRRHKSTTKNCMKTYHSKSKCATFKDLQNTYRGNPNIFDDAKILRNLQIHTFVPLLERHRYMVNRLSSASDEVCELGFKTVRHDVILATASYMRSVPSSVTLCTFHVHFCKH